MTKRKQIHTSPLMMSISAPGLRSVIKHEGSREQMYHDSAGLPTIGVGHLLTRSELSSCKIEIIDAKWRDGLSKQQYTALLKHDIRIAEDAVRKYVKVDITQSMFDALTSFTFNVGARAFRNSTLLKRLNSEKYAQVPAQFKRWVYAGGKRVNGLVNRRNAEAELFLA